MDLLGDPHQSRQKAGVVVVRGPGGRGKGGNEAFVHDEARVDQRGVDPQPQRRIPRIVREDRAELQNQRKGQRNRERAVDKEGQQRTLHSVILYSLPLAAAA